MRPKPPPFPEAGEHFEEFQLVSLLGTGGTSRVFLARDLSLGGKQVVLKVSLDRGQEPQGPGGTRSSAHRPGQLGRLRRPRRCAGCRCRTGRGCRSTRSSGGSTRPSRPRHAMALWEALVRPPEATAASATKPDATSARRTRRRSGPRGDGWEGFPVRGTYAQGVAWIVMILAEALHYAHGQQTFHRDVKPAQRAADAPARPAVARLQPGRVAPFGVAGPGGDARRYAPLHGPRADRGLPQSRSLGQGRAPGRHLFARAGPPRAADRTGARPAGRDALAAPARCASCSIAGRCSTSRSGGPTRRSPMPSRRSSPSAWPFRPRIVIPTPAPWPRTSIASSRRQPLVHARQSVAAASGSRTGEYAIAFGWLWRGHSWRSAWPAYSRGWCWNGRADLFGRRAVSRNLMS